MQVNAVGNMGRASNAADRFELSPQDFWKLLLTQLQTQDPFRAGDMTAMMEQFVAMQTAREMARLSDALQRVQILLLLGHSVQAVVDGNLQAGKVIGVSLAGAPSLLMQAGGTTLTVPLSAVTSVMTDAPARSLLVKRA